VPGCHLPPPEDRMPRLWGSSRRREFARPGADGAPGTPLFHSDPAAPVGPGASAPITGPAPGASGRIPPGQGPPRPVASGPVAGIAPAEPAGPHARPAACPVSRCQASQSDARRGSGMTPDKGCTSRSKDLPGERVPPGRVSFFRRRPAQASRRRSNDVFLPRSANVE